MPAFPAPITLTTDFGQSDHYVAQMKGAILRVAPNATIIDITHAIPPQEVRAACFLLADLAGSFPPGTVHLAVIDPGVGSSRRIIALQANDQFYVAPDNGLLTLVLEQCPKATAVEIPIRPTDAAISNTFHGRDVMAPAAARLAHDQTLDAVGDAIVNDPVRLFNLHPRQSGGKVFQIDGTTVWIDHFGNVITNIPKKMLADVDTESLAARCGELSVHGLRSYYAEVPEGEPLLLVGSSGRLEIAANGGNAAQRGQVQIGDPIILTLDA